MSCTLPIPVKPKKNLFEFAIGNPEMYCAIFTPNYHWTINELLVTRKRLLRIFSEQSKIILINLDGFALKEITDSSIAFDIDTRKMLWEQMQAEMTEMKMKCLMEIRRIRHFHVHCLKSLAGGMAHETDVREWIG